MKTSLKTKGLDFDHQLSLQQKKRICSNWISDNIIYKKGSEIGLKKLHNAFKIKHHAIEINLVSKKVLYFISIYNFV